MQVLAPQVVHVTFPVWFLTTIAFLLLFGLAGVFHQISAVRRHLPVTTKSLATLAIPLFVGLAATFAGCSRIAIGLRISGGGAAARAAAAAEAQGPILMAIAIAAGLGVLLLIRAFRPGTAGQLRFPDSGLVASGLALVIGLGAELLLCRWLVATSLIDSTPERWAGALAFGLLLPPLVIAWRAFRSRNATPLPISWLVAIEITVLASLAIVWMAREEWAKAARGLIAA